MVTVTENSRLYKLEHTPIHKLLFTYALPSVVGAVVTALYNIVDRIFIGQGVGDDAIAGMTITFPIFIFMVAFGLLVGSGSAVRVSIYLGRNDRSTAQRLLSNAILLTLFFNVLFCTLVLIFADPLLHLFGGNEVIIPYAKQYLYIVVPANIISDLSFSYNAIMRASGYPHKAMYTMLIGAGLNTILDPIFIFVFQWGIAGAAWATVISTLVTAIFVMSHFFNTQNVLHFSRSWSSYRLDFRMMIAIVSIGIAPFSMMMVSSMISIIINKGCGMYASSITEANIAIAAYGIIMSIAQLFVQFMVGVSLGMQPIVGFNYGAGKIHRSIDTYKAALLVNVCMALLGFSMAIFTPDLIVRAFSKGNDSLLVPFTASAIGIAMMAFPMVGVQVTTVQFFQSLGKSYKSMFLSLTRQLIYFIPGLLILPRFWGLTGIWMSMPIADILSGATSIVMVLHQIPRMKRAHNTALEKEQKKEV